MSKITNSNIGGHPAKYINVPTSARNPYTIWFKYAGQNITVYNSIAFKYNMERITAPLYIN